MIKNTIKNKGFTLIELLVVIAIIGILAAVVLASLSDARDSAKESAIVQQVDNMAKLMELNSIQTPGPAYGSGNRAVWITGNGIGQTCDAATLTGLTADNQVKFREICNSIHEASGYTGTQLIYVVWWANHATYGTYYSFTVRFGANSICAGSSGGRYNGPFDFYSPGCRFNP